MFGFRKKQTGQTLVMMTGVLLLVTSLLFAVTDMGKHARQQFYLQSVADNAAYSAAVAMSRQMNFMALTNRALIGNQVAIAQWVGLASYLAMLDRTAENLETITSFIPYVAQITRAISMIVERIEESFAEVARLLVAFQALVVQGISEAQWLLNAGFIVELPLLINDVVSKHSEELGWSSYQGGGIAPFPALWARKTHSKSTERSNESEFFEDLTVKSLDPFSKSRSYDWVDLYSFKVPKRGGTELASDNDGSWDWHALDSVSLHKRRLLIGGFREVLPLGWGAKAQDERRSRRSNYGGAFRDNSMSSSLALGQMESLRVSQDSFSYRILGRTLSLSMDSVILKVMGDEQVAYAKARTRFIRPSSLFPRTDSLIENENLFNALWEAFLEPLNSEEKLVLLGREFI